MGKVVGLMISYEWHKICEVCRATGEIWVLILILVLLLMSSLTRFNLVYVFRPLIELLLLASR